MDILTSLTIGQEKQSEIPNKYISRSLQHVWGEAAITTEKEGDP